MQFTPVLALYDPFGVDVPLNLDNTNIYKAAGCFITLCLTNMYKSTLHFYNLPDIYTRYILIHVLSLLHVYFYILIHSSSKGLSLQLLYYYIMKAFTLSCTKQFIYINYQTIKGNIYQTIKGNIYVYQLIKLHT